MRPLTKEEKEAIDRTAYMLWEQLGVNNAIDSVERVDRYVDYLHSVEWTEEEKYNHIMVVGAYLGKAMLSKNRGRWHYDEEYQSYAVKFSGVDFVVYPMTKAAKHINNGSGDSIASMYYSTDVIIRDMKKVK